MTLSPRFFRVLMNIAVNCFSHICPYHRYHTAEQATGNLPVHSALIIFQLLRKVNTGSQFGKTVIMECGESSREIGTLVFMPSPSRAEQLCEYEKPHFDSAHLLSSWIVTSAVIHTFLPPGCRPLFFVYARLGLGIDAADTCSWV